MSKIKNRAAVVLIMEAGQGIFIILICPREMVDYYCKVFNTVELNVTFYRLPLASTFHQKREKYGSGLSF